MQQFHKKKHEDDLDQERSELIQEKHKKNRGTKKKFLIGCGVFFILTLAGLGYAFFGPGGYDEFAQCLTAKGAKMYGEDWCQYTNAQKGMFGRSFKHIDYQVKSDLEIRPTWVIEGKNYETVQSFERLSELTGCKI